LEIWTIGVELGEEVATPRKFFELFVWKYHTLVHYRCKIPATADLKRFMRTKIPPVFSSIFETAVAQKLCGGFC